MTKKVTFINLEEELEDRSSLISPSARACLHLPAARHEDGRNFAIARHALDDVATRLRLA
jgi:hypothetical protein